MRRLGITMEQLVALVAVAEEGSLERAGKALGLSRSALGRQIVALEQAVGARLFEQRRGTWIPNDEGLVLLPEAFEVILHARAGIDLVQSRVRLRTHRFAIGYSTFLSPSLIEVIRGLGARWRVDVAVRYESLLTQSSVLKVLRGELDAGFGYLPLREPLLLVRQIFEEHLAVLLPTGHPLAVKRALAPEALEQAALIAIAREALPLRFEQTENHFRSIGIRLRYVEECFSANEAIASVARGTGVCLLPRSRARSGEGVVARPLDDPLLTYKSGVFVRSDHDDEVTREFLALVQQRTVPLRPRGGQPRS